MVTAKSGYLAARLEWNSKHSGYGYEELGGLCYCQVIVLSVVSLRADTGYQTDGFREAGALEEWTPSYVFIYVTEIEKRNMIGQT